MTVSKGLALFPLKDTEKILFPVSEWGVGSRDSFWPMSSEQKCDFWLLGSDTGCPLETPRESFPSVCKWPSSIPDGTVHSVVPE